MRNVLALLGLLVFVGWVFSHFTEPPSSRDSHNRAQPETTAAVSKAAKCDRGDTASGNVVAVATTYEPRTTPSEAGNRIQNEKASTILKRVQYHQIDSSTTVRELCTEGDWSLIRIVTPGWLTHVTGWVPKRVLRGIDRTNDGVRVYVESDFIWHDDDASQFKREIMGIVNKIAREHAGCSRIDTASIALSPSRSGPGDPVFFVTCDPPGSLPFNVWFRPSEADKTFKPIPAISEADAILQCEDAVKAQATHPSTVDFSRIVDAAYSARPDGRASLDSTFTAKNSFNLELKYRVRCLFDGVRLIETNIVELRPKIP